MTVLGQPSTCAASCAASTRRLQFVLVSLVPPELGVSYIYGASSSLSAAEVAVAPQQHDVGEVSIWRFPSFASSTLSELAHSLPKSQLETYSRCMQQRSPKFLRVLDMGISLRTFWDDHKALLGRLIVGDLWYSAGRVAVLCPTSPCLSIVNLAHDSTGMTRVSHNSDNYGPDMNTYRTTHISINRV
eukprot:4112267-Amphidinium_carterae.1